MRFGIDCGSVFDLIFVFETGRDLAGVPFIGFESVSGGEVVGVTESVHAMTLNCENDNKGISSLLHKKKGEIVRDYREKPK